MAKSTIGIPEVFALPGDTVASDREAIEGREKALEATTLAQDNIVREWFGGRESSSVIWLGVLILNILSAGSK